MKREDMRSNLLFSAIAVSIVIAGLQLAAIPYMTTTEVLMQDFDLDLRMGFGYGSMSGTVKAHAVDVESSGEGNSVVLELSAEANSFYNLEATRDSGDLQVFVQDEGQYPTQQFLANASSFKLIYAPDSSIDELRFNDVNASLITSNNYAEYDAEFQMDEGFTAPWISISSEYFWSGFHPYMLVHANGNKSTLLLYGYNLSMSIDESNHSFSGRTVLWLYRYDDINLDWETTKCVRYLLTRGTRALIWESLSFRIGNLTGFVKSVGSIALNGDNITGDEFRWIRLWTGERIRSWDEWVHMKLTHGKLTVIRDGEESSLNLIERTVPSAWFDSEDDQRNYLVAVGAFTSLPALLLMLRQWTKDRKKEN